MNPERHARAKAIFIAALEMDGAARDRYVAEACAGDDSLHQEVASLLISETARAPGDPPRANVDRVPTAPTVVEGVVLAGRYELGRVLGSGGMGRVYAAVDARFGRSVAVKELVLSTPAVRAGFEREARLLNGLRHRALPVVIDYFSEADRFFLVMDFVSGRDFGEVLRARREAGEGPLPLPDVLRWADQILDALEYLGSLSPPVVHRDIKPQNIKLTDAGEAVLLDFGLAKDSASGAASGPLRSIAAFTPHFAPLEQIRGGGTDARSDLYALGATLYSMLTGVAPSA
jgi:eukaryotic-like serine/threonine-protein kinase